MIRQSDLSERSIIAIITLQEAVHDGFNGRMQALTRMGELTVEERDRAVHVCKFKPFFKYFSHSRTATNLIKKPRGENHGEIQ